MNVAHPRVDGLSDTSKIELFAEWFVRSPFAKSTLEGGQPFKIYLPIKRRENAGLGGVEITIACVRKRVDPARYVLASERGNGHSNNPAGPLQPGDFGVHSHPDTAKLMKVEPPSEKLPRS